MSHDTPPPIDKRRARASFERAAPDYDHVAVLQREIADRLLERLDYIRIEPQRILDIGSGTGYVSEALLKRYRRAEVLALDFAHAMLLRARRRGSWWRRPRCLCADAEALPLADDSVDLILSSATFQWCNDIERTFAECRRVLRPGGLLLFTSFGPDTLMELRRAWSAVDAHAHVSPFLDMHDLGDALVRARLADPVMDAEHLTLTYTDLTSLMRDLKTLGARNATRERPRGLTSRRQLAALEAAYESERREDRLPATYEVLYGHAWMPEHDSRSASVSVPLSTLTRADQTLRSA